MRFYKDCLIVLAVWVFYLLACPFTKVEESFNVQAMHDMLFHGFNISQYDHLEFSGVVPRTFTGPLMISTLIKPMAFLANLLHVSKVYVLIACRLCLCLLVFAPFRAFTNQIRKQLGDDTSFWFCIITVSQFHFNFYASRPLPNIFALEIVLCVYTFFLRRKYTMAVWAATISVVLYRSELVLLYAPLFLPLLRSKKLGLFSAILNGILAAALVLFFTVPLDSLLWGRFVWPEGEVWWYNVVLNKSKDWGILPFWWYFYSALPRCLGFSLILAFLSMVLLRKMLGISVAALVFVLLYSFLPHKELRFIIYVIPALNLQAAIFCQYVWAHRKGSLLMQLLGLCCIGHLLTNVAMSAVLFEASRTNYPGGKALMQLNYNLTEQERLSPVSMHIDVYCAQNGISRFLQTNEMWRYNKTEDLNVAKGDFGNFDYLCVGDEIDLEYKELLYSDSHTVAGKFKAFDGIHLNRLNRFPFMQFWLKFKEKVMILKKKTF